MKIKLYIRGGAWLNNARLARCAFRNKYYPDGWLDSLGFRCCFPPFFVIKRPENEI